MGTSKTFLTDVLYQWHIEVLAASMHYCHNDVSTDRRFGGQCFNQYLIRSANFFDETNSRVDPVRESN